MSNFERLAPKHDKGVLAHDDYYGLYMAHEQILDFQEASEEQNASHRSLNSHVDYAYGRYGRFLEEPLETANPLQNNRLK